MAVACQAGRLRRAASPSTCVLRAPHKRGGRACAPSPAAPPLVRPLHLAAAARRSAAARRARAAGAVDLRFRPLPSSSARGEPPIVFVSIYSFDFVPELCPSMPGAPAPMATRAAAAPLCACAGSGLRKKIRWQFCTQPPARSSNN
jgi:hypothetical protein